MQLKPLAGFTGRKALFDVETYPNYILLTFHDVDTETTTRFRIAPDNGTDDRKAAEAYYRSLAVAVTYNGHGYDDHIPRRGISRVSTVSTCGNMAIRSFDEWSSPFTFIGKHGDPKPGFPLA
jgi:hypothetical protein